MCPIDFWEQGAQFQASDLMGSEPEDYADSSLVSEDRLQGKPLKHVHTSLIKPSAATPSEKEWLPLSSLDYLWVSYYTPILCSFPLADQEHNEGSAAGVVQHLRDSLADALVLFYPLAGRVVTKDGPPRIHCNDAGAVFTEASAGVELADLRTDDFQPQPLLSGLAAAGLGDYPVLPQIETGLPALIIQVNIEFQLFILNFHLHNYRLGNVKVKACYGNNIPRHLSTASF